jgi:hypothetical protein
MESLSSFLKSLTVGEAIAHRNLAVFPLFGGLEGPPGYVTLDGAVAAGTARVTEVSAGGHVPELSFVNSGPEAVLLLDGEELVGAKQNRVLNLTILVPAGASVKIPVSCVEQGRWSYRSEGFTPSGRAFFRAGRAQKVQRVTENLRAQGAPRSDQGQVWEDIAGKMERMAVASHTGAMSDLFEARAHGVEEYVRALRPQPGQCGAVFALDGKVAGLELFDATSTFEQALPKLIRSYALDALETLAPRKRAPKAPAGAEAAAFLTGVREAQVTLHASLGEGRDARFSQGHLSGAGLIARDRVVHLLAFAMPSSVEGGPGRGATGTRIHRRRPRPEDPTIVY